MNNWRHVFHQRMLAAPEASIEKSPPDQALRIDLWLTIKSTSTNIIIWGCLSVCLHKEFFRTTFEQDLSDPWIAITQTRGKPSGLAGKRVCLVPSGEMESTFICSHNSALHPHTTGGFPSPVWGESRSEGFYEQAMRTCSTARVRRLLNEFSPPTHRSTVDPLTENLRPDGNGFRFSSSILV